MITLKDFTKERFNSLSRHLINSYRKRDFGFIDSLFTRLYGSTTSSREADTKQKFYALIKLYHPDSLAKHISDFTEAERGKDLQRLQFFEKLLLRYHEPQKVNRNRIDDSFTVVEEYYYPYDPDEEEVLSEQLFEHDFLHIIKQRYFGNLNVHFEPIDLQQLDGELNLSYQDLYDLEGLEHCINITSLDLSHNSLSNIYQLHALERLVELDLSYNDLHDIDILENLFELETLYLEENDLEQIDILAKLPNLKVVTLYGNPLSDSKTIAQLQSSGVIVITER